MKKEKIKAFLNKCLFDKKTNDFVITLLFIPLLILGLCLGQPAIYCLGGMALAIINVIIKKVVMAKQNKIVESNFKESEKGGK